MVKVKLAQLQIPIDAAGFPSKLTFASSERMQLGFDVLGLHVTIDGRHRVIPAANVKYVEVFDDSASE